MAWSFRKRIKIAPGVSINISKSGISASIGPKGTSFTIGSNGTYINTGIPGTGIYSRKKISGQSSFVNTSAENTPYYDNNINDKGVRIGCGMFILVILLGACIKLLSKPWEEISEDIYVNLCVMVVALVMLYLIFRPWLKRETNTSQKTSETVDFVSLPFDIRLRDIDYEYIISRYNEEEQKVIEKSIDEIDHAKKRLEVTTDLNKIIFLQSIIDYTETNKLTRLINFYHYDIDKITDKLDPLFEQVAQKVVASQTCDFSVFFRCLGREMTYERQDIIVQQLKECGIVEQDPESLDKKVIVNDAPMLHAILQKSNGKTLLSKEDKIKINEYLDTRKVELIGNKPIQKCLCFPENVIISYQTFINAYNSLISSKSIWEILSIHENTEEKSSSRNFVDREVNNVQCSENFKYVQPTNNERAAHFTFPNAGIDIYIYPRFVVVANHSDFDVMPLSQFDIEFNKSNFIEESSLLIPTDAKLVRYTYKYVNRNGERDARYSRNPRYGVYEYGDVTFKSLGLTLQFSNSELAENFVQAFQLLQNGTITNSSPLVDVSEKFFNNSKDVANMVGSFYESLANRRDILRAADAVLPDDIGDAKDKLLSLFLSDVIKCFESLGYDATSIISKEGVPLAMVEGYVIFNKPLDYKTITSSDSKYIIDRISKLNKIHKDALLINKADNFFFLNEIFKSLKQNDLITQYFSLLYRLFSVVAKADGKISEEESSWLENLMSYSQRNTNYKLEKFERAAGIKPDIYKDSRGRTEQHHNADTIEDPLLKIQSLIGLENVKKEITALANYIKIQKEREKNGLKTVNLSFHCVFTGNPGTGKTTVARILADIYKSLGVLKKGHLVETDRSGLIAEYVGQTAMKTNRVIDSALDGVLFIDEAYSLVQGGNNDYSNEAISTLLKRMEDDRDRLIVIIAGYNDEMKKFIDSNPGLQSRFNRFIHFEDYNVEELKSIFLLNARSNQYKLDIDAEKVLMETLTHAVERKDKNFGNGRFVRNLFETALQNQAVRLACLPQTTAEELSTLTKNDIPLNI